VFRLLARRFRDMSDEILRERGDDIDDLSRVIAIVGLEFTHSLETCLRTPCSSHVGCSLRTRCSRVRPLSLYLQSSLAPRLSGSLARELDIPVWWDS
jgi:hypothetical protein